MGTFGMVPGHMGGTKHQKLSSGLSLPRFKGLIIPLVACISLLSQDWLKSSFYKDPSLGLSVGLISSRHHDLVYNLTWHTLRNHLRHSLLSSLKYTFKLEMRDWPLRPTRGYALVSTLVVCFFLLLFFFGALT
uniref:Uncharacterized protein n=1 Tax=Nelumbo nucifera TaxID=4432 RepID=A0A822Y6K6_NELNU|nr:TPA_asm: hypothetical protein HUJ06_029565 [Nelumbo nucifera]